MTTNEYERMVLNEGLVVYDGALAQLLWALVGDLKHAVRLSEVVWKGSLGVLRDLRAYYAGYNRAHHPFNYLRPGDEILSPEEIIAPTSESEEGGRRGFVFKIINAEGKWQTRDPLTGDRLTWSQWQPIAGENAWAGVIGPMQVYYNKYGRKVVPDAVELNLAEEIARVAIILQAENGGVRMGPKGTWHESGRLDFYFNTQSVENNLSWYAAFRMLYEITGKQMYKDAMDKVEGFLKASFDKQRGIFVQGWHYSDGVWRQARIFATDCQTWAIDVLGAKKIDEWFGEGTAFKMWQETKRRAGVFSQDKELLGLDFTDVNTSLPEALKRAKMVSVEWSAGGIFACRDKAELYKSTHPDWASEAAEDAKTMFVYIETLKITKKDGSVGYPYASGRGPSANRATGHGWFAPTQDVESTASTVWMALARIKYNPFILGGRRSMKTGALPLQQRREFLLGPIYDLLRPVESAI